MYLICCRMNLSSDSSNTARKELKNPGFGTSQAWVCVPSRMSLEFIGVPFSRCRMGLPGKVDDLECE